MSTFSIAFDFYDGPVLLFDCTASYMHVGISVFIVFIVGFRSNLRILFSSKSNSQSVVNSVFTARDL